MKYLLVFYSLIVIALVGNKIDLIEREVIDYNEGSTYGKVNIFI